MFSSCFISNWSNLVWDVFLGQRMQRNSTLDDIARVNFMHAYIGGVLDALRYAYFIQTFPSKGPLIGF